MTTTTTTEKNTTAPPPPSAKQSALTDTRINGIVDDISGLTLLQAADLVTALKVHFLSLPIAYI
jgi:large subunit ribosomal protein L7/L12